MNRRKYSAVALGAVLSCSSLLAQPAEITIRVPDTAAARSNAGLISRAERAIRRYIDACESADARDPRDIVTSDAQIEYPLDSPGSYLTLDASALFAGCTAATISSAGQRPLWIYPSGEKNTVFVQYDMPAADGGATPTQQVALIEMRGARILRMRNFGDAAPALLAAMRGTAQSQLCARLSPLGSGVLATTSRSP